MTDHEQNQPPVVDPHFTADHAPTLDPEVTEADHPHAGIAADGWSSPQAEVPTPPTGAKLVLKRAGAETDIEFPLSPPATIGRFDPTMGPIDVDLGCVPEGQYVSRKHATLHFEEGAWSLQDLGSSNGTYVLRNGSFEKIETAELTDGQEFALGNARFVFKTGGPAHALSTEPLP